MPGDEVVISRCPQTCWLRSAGWNRRFSGGLSPVSWLQDRARAAERDRAERAVGVRVREQRGAVVLQPGEPEQVALVAAGDRRALAARSRCSAARLRKWLSAVNVLGQVGRRRGEVGRRRLQASARAGARRARTGGSASRTIGVASSASGLTCAFARSSAFTGGRRSSAVGRRTRAKRSTLPSVSVVCRSVPGRSPTARPRFCCSEANVRNTFEEESTSAASWSSLPRELGVELVQRVDEAAQVAVALRRPRR